MTEGEDDAFVAGESELPDSKAQIEPIELYEAYFAILSNNLAQGLIFLLLSPAIAWYSGYNTLETLFFTAPWDLFEWYYEGAIAVIPDGFAAIMSGPIEGQGTFWWIIERLLLVVGAIVHLVVIVGIIGGFVLLLLVGPFGGLGSLIRIAFGFAPFGPYGYIWWEPDEEDGFRRWNWQWEPDEEGGFLSIRELVEDRIDKRRSFEKAIPGGALTMTAIFLLSVSSWWYFVWVPESSWVNNEESIIVVLLGIISFPVLLFIIFKILAIIDDEWIRFRKGYGRIWNYETTQLAKAALAELGAKQSTMSQREFRRRFDILKKRLEDVEKTMGEPSRTTSHRTPEDPSQGVVAPALQESQGDSFFKKYDTANYPFCHSCGRQVLPGVLRTCDKCGKQRCINCGGSGHCRDCNRGVYH